MPTYIYESIPNDESQPEMYEFEQRMSDQALTTHPMTGVPIRRIPAGGAGITGFAQPDCGTDCGVPGSGTGSCCPCFPD